MIRYRATATLRRPQIHYSKTLPQKRAGGIQNQREHHIYSRTLKNACYLQIVRRTKFCIEQ